MHQAAEIAPPKTMVLSPRQREITLLVCAGKANKEIATATGLALATVEEHLSTLYRKFKICPGDRVTLALCAVRRGIAQLNQNYE